MVAVVRHAKTSASSQSLFGRAVSIEQAPAIHPVLNAKRSPSFS